MEIPLKYIHVKNTLLLTVLLFAVNIVSSQIFVSNNASLYIFNKGTYIYDAGNLELNGPNSNFYLRNEGQFLQATAGAGANTGIGKLSVFQEGTVNNYAYNYWCSPVGNASAAIGNEPFGILKSGHRFWASVLGNPRQRGRVDLLRLTFATGREC